MPLFDELYERLRLLGDRGASFDENAREALLISSEIAQDEMSAEQAAALLFVSSSLIINAAVDMGDVAMMQAGAGVARRAQGLVATDHPLHWQAEYNIANSMICECDLGLPSEGAGSDWVSLVAENRRSNRSKLRHARKMLDLVGGSPDADP